MAMVAGKWTLGVVALSLAVAACEAADEPAREAPLPRERLGQPGSAPGTPGSSTPSSNAGPSANGEVDGSAPSASSDAATSPSSPADGASPTPATPTLARPSQAVIDTAKAAALSSYHRNANTGDIWCLPCDGAPVILGAAAFAGDNASDARLLEQMRHVIIGTNAPFATGAYAANDERNVTAMFAIAKRIPRVWSKLTAAEVAKIDLVMKATLVSGAYLTADKTNAGTVPADFTGSTNHNREWNPNYREGMIGAVLVATEYFGGEVATKALLESYDHAAFTAALAAGGLTNTEWTFGTYQRAPSAGAPSPATVEQGVAGYTLHGKTIGQVLEHYLALANDTFSLPVSCGLNGGAGIVVGAVAAGTIVSGCPTLPNVGAMGMQKEFDSVDAEGKRSSAGYVRLGLRANLMNQLVLAVYGDWQKTAASSQALARVKVGVTDFFYKAKQGYRGYSHAQDEGVFACGTDMDCTLNEAIWTQILAPFHGL